MRSLVPLREVAIASDRTLRAWIRWNRAASPKYACDTKNCQNLSRSGVCTQCLRREFDARTRIRREVKAKSLRAKIRQLTDIWADDVVPKEANDE